MTLMFLAPLIAEVLPGATRFSSIFVFPIEVFVWGGGALLIRYIVRKWQLGWINMLLLGLALSVAEEFLIQQTSVAPMVIQLKGITYARAFGINYVYLFWALVYETVFVVFLPIYLTEIIFADRQKELWIGKGGVIATGILFLLGSFLAWYSWTQIARSTVFHVAPYNPPLLMILCAVVSIGCLVFAATGPFSKKLIYGRSALKLLPDTIMIVIGAFWAIVLYGIVGLAFGLKPSFPPVLALATGLILVISALYFIPAWIANANWNQKHSFFLISGIMLGSMMVGFVGFVGSMNLDLYFKILINLLAVIFLVLLGIRVNRQFS